MDFSVLGEVLIILVLVLANGFFAAAEIAIIAAPRGKLRQLADNGDKPAKIALHLAENPNYFLPTVQLGITLVSTFAAAYGGAGLATSIAAGLKKVRFPWVAEHAEFVALVVVVLCIAFCSVLLGELVPKRLALQSAHKLSRFFARPMSLLATIGRPFVWFMGRATNVVLLLLRNPVEGEPAVSREDIEHLITSGEASGILEPTEKRVALEALRLGDRTAKDIMRPRIDIDALEIDTEPDVLLGAVAMSGFSRLPVYEGHLDNIVGFVYIKDLLRRLHLRLPTDVRSLLRPPIFVPESLPLDRLLVKFQEQSSQLAVVLDEFGGTEGIVTLEDVLEELIGDIRDEHRRDDQQKIVRRADGSWLIDGSVNIEEFAETLNVPLANLPTPRNYTTAAGLMLSLLERIAKVGDRVPWEGHQLEVVDMDGQRIDRLLVSQQRTPDKS